MQASLFRYNSRDQESNTHLLQSLQYEQLVRGINGAGNHTPHDPTTSNKIMVVGEVAAHYGFTATEPELDE